MKSLKPDFLIVGAEKSGTTWLKHVLNENPEIFIPSEKEIHFFDKEINYKKGMKWYREYFKKHENQTCGEITPGYLSGSALCAERIKASLPNVKLIAILRNPIDRAISNYHMLSIAGLVKSNITKHLIPGDPIVEKGKYKKQLLPFFNLFESNSILLLKYDRINNDSKALIAEIEKFLGVPPLHQYSLMGKKIFRGKRVRFLWINKLYSSSAEIMKFFGLGSLVKLFKGRIQRFNQAFNVKKNGSIRIPKLLLNDLQNYYLEDLVFLENYWEESLEDWRK
jgi:Sulfotransferase domain